MQKKILGAHGELLAQKYLLKQNFIILAKNYRSRFGEIDIIAKKNCDIIFCEVKTRTNLSHGAPSESVSLTKQKKIKLSALDYISKYQIINSNFRFDIIEIVRDKINHIISAFEF